MKALLNILAFGGVFIAACLGIHRNLPAPEVPEVQAKLEYLKKHLDDFDTLFIGSSHVYRQIDPAEFDQAAREHGHPAKSFNAGIDGMQPPEDSYFLDEILKFRPQRLKWVFVEVNQMRARLDDAKRGTARAVYWHDWERLGQLFRESVDVKPSRHLRGKIKALWGPMEDFSEHVALFMQNTSNLGRGANDTDRWLHGDRAQVLWASLGQSSNGYLGIEGVAMSDADRADYAQELANRRANPPETNPGSVTSREAILRMTRELEAIGAEPIFIVPPSIPSQNFRPPTAGENAPPIFDFTGIVQYPALYEESARLNSSHLNAAGAEAFSRALAERFSAWEDGRRPH